MSLFLNVTKPKEMVVAFRKKRSTISPITIMGQNVELVDTYRHLGVLLHNKLDWRATQRLSTEGEEQTLLLEKAQVLLGWLSSWLATRWFQAGD